MKLFDAVPSDLFSVLASPATGAGSIRVDVVWPFGIALPSTAVESILSIDKNNIHKVVLCGKISESQKADI